MHFLEIVGSMRCTCLIAIMVYCVCLKVDLHVDLLDARCNILQSCRLARLLSVDDCGSKGRGVIFSKKWE